MYLRIIIDIINIGCEELSNVFYGSSISNTSEMACVMLPGRMEEGTCDLFKNICDLKGKSHKKNFNDFRWHDFSISTSEDHALKSLGQNI